MIRQRVNTIIFLGAFALTGLLATTAMTSRRAGGLAELFSSPTPLPIIATLARRPSATPINTAVVIPSMAPTDTLIPPPTNTPLPTSTPLPTNTPPPTSTPLPAITLAITEIVPPTSPPLPTATAMPWPTPAGITSAREARVPILMYHYVEPMPADADYLRQGLTVTPEAFREQLAYLRDQGYYPVDLYQLLNVLALGVELPGKPMILTFDDGYRGVYEYAFPIMQEFGYTGTVFVATQLIDERHPSYLTWEMAEEMAAAGWRIEPHTKTHVEVDNQSRDFVIYQVLGSMQTIEAHVGYQPRFFSYPGGAFDDHAIGILRELNFWGAVTTQGRQIHVYGERYLWGRVRVNGREGLEDLAARLGEPFPTATPGGDE